MPDKELILKAVAEYKHEKASYFVDAAKLKEKQLDNAVKNIVTSNFHKVKPEDIVAFMDTTVFSNGKKGIFLTKDKLLMSRDFSSDNSCVRWSEIDNICQVKKDGDQVIFLRPSANSYYLYRINAGIYCDDIYNFFVTLMDLEGTSKSDAPVINKQTEKVPAPQIEVKAQASKNAEHRAAVPKKEAAPQKTCSVLIYSPTRMIPEMLLEAFRKVTGYKKKIRFDENGIGKFTVEVMIDDKAVSFEFTGRGRSLGYSAPTADAVIFAIEEHDFASNVRLGNYDMGIPADSNKLIFCLWDYKDSYGTVSDLAECQDAYSQVEYYNHPSFVSGVALDENGFCTDEEGSKLLRQILELAAGSTEK